jgi:hypothetical protein
MLPPLGQSSSPSQSAPNESRRLSGFFALDVSERMSATTVIP